jgi:hypothetical protein
MRQKDVVAVLTASPIAELHSARFLASGAGAALSPIQRSVGPTFRRDPPVVQGLNPAAVPDDRLVRAATRTAEGDQVFATQLLQALGQPIHRVGIEDASSCRRRSLRYSRSMRSRGWEAVGM